MKFDAASKERIYATLADHFRKYPEIKRVIVFGSFVSQEDPNDLDLAVFSENTEDYLVIALRLRRQLRALHLPLPVDLIPIHCQAEPSLFLSSIEEGKVVYAA
jgi:predicted nucleotidyltransferase